MGMIHVQKFVLTVLGLASLPAHLPAIVKTSSDGKNAIFHPLMKVPCRMTALLGPFSFVVLFAAILCSSGFNKGK